MKKNEQINIEARIDGSPFGFYQIRVILLCVGIALLEGYDLQVISFAAPGILEEWAISRSSLGIAFSSSLFGLMIGALVLGAAADRFGRRALTIACFAVVGLLTFLTAYISTMNELVILRFITGVAIGGAMPGAIALVSEYSPKRYRALNVTIMACGFPLGSVLGGLAAAPLISEFGWRSAFVLGGVLPLILCVLLLVYLPESIRFLALKPSRKEAVARLLSYIDPSYKPQPTDCFIQPAKDTQKVGFRDIFSQGRLFGTLLLWFLFALNLMMLYLMISWLPTILTEAGFDVSNAIMATSMFSAAGILSGLALGRIVDKASPYRALVLTYLFAAGVTVVMSFSGLSPALLLLLVFLSGIGILGPQMVLNALAANFYPPEIRSAGIGASLSVGRIGAIVGPLAGSALMTMGLPSTQIFITLAVPAVFCAVAIYILGRQKPAAHTADTFKPIREFDHLMCGVKDIEASGKSFEALGFTVGPITPLNSIGVSNSRILLTPKGEDIANYIEFMQLGGASGTIPSFLQKWLKGSLNGQEGAHSLIMRTDDAKRTFAYFKDQHRQDPSGGFDPYLLEMDFDQQGPGGEMYHVGFSNCIMPGLETPLYVSTSQIRTLDFYLNEAWRTHKNGAHSWTETLAVSKAPLETAKALQDLWGGDITEGPNGCFITTPGELPLKIFSPSGFEAEYGKATGGSKAVSRAKPYTAGVHVSVRDMAQTKAFFEHAKITTYAEGSRLILPAEACHGLLICFEQDTDIGKL